MPLFLNQGDQSNADQGHDPDLNLRQLMAELGGFFFRGSLTRHLLRSGYVIGGISVAKVQDWPRGLVGSTKLLEMLATGG